MTIEHVPYGWAPTSDALNTWIDEINNATGAVIGSAMTQPYTSIAGDLTLNSTHGFVAVSATGGPRTITLPTAFGITGRIYTIKKTDVGATNAVTINTTSGQTVDNFGSGSGALKLYGSMSSITVLSTGSGWRIISRQKSVRSQWNPVLASSGTAPNLGTGGLSQGWWWEDGEVIEGVFYFTFGTSPSAGTGDYRVDMPTPVASNNTYGTMGHGLFYDASLNSGTTLFLEQDGGTNRIVMIRDGSGKVGATIPVAPAAGDNYRGYFRYYKA
jgi:hypothetical protein